MKKIFLVIMSVLVMAVMAGCGSDKLVGDWIFKGKDIALGGESLEIIHIEKSDNGKYLLTRESKAYRQEYAYIATTSLEKLALGKDATLNAKDAFSWKHKLFGLVDGIWNGTTLKLERKYKLYTSKDDRVGQLNKEDFTMKDGKLLFFNNYYEKVDKAKIDKVMSDWKESLKKEVGMEQERNVPNIKVKVKTVIARVTIVENGKEEVFGEK